jgi:GNAT superfamily N-acetyltransferase
MNETGARLATPDDASAVATTLAKAFADDPVWGLWTFPEATDRVQLLEEFWAPFVAAALKYDGAWMTGAGEAVALWVPPGMPEMDDDDEVAAAEIIARVCGERAPLVSEAFERFGAARPTADHWYLSLLATHPEQRGRGLGMALVADRLAFADSTGQAAYLESTNPVNIERYRRAGFEILGAFNVPEGPQVDTMWRPGRVRR